MMGLNPITVLQHILNFILLCVLLRLILYKPVMKFLEERRDKIAQEQQKTQEELQEAEELLRKYTVALQEADAEASKRVKDSVAQARQEAESILEHARQEAQDMLTKARADIERERKQAIADMRNDLATMAVEMASQVLQREVSLKDNQDIIDNFFDKVG